MVTNRVIRVDDDVYGSLQKVARPFDDTPNSVLRRILGLDEANPQPAGGAPEPGPGGAGRRTPQEAFRRPILEAVVELGGKARVPEVLRHVEQKMEGKLTRVDHSKTKSGLPRWQVYARWLRMRLVHEGLLSGGERGYWEITAEGRAFLKRPAR
jgi:hypothetical protein